MRLKDIIIEYLQNTIISKRNMTKRIFQLEEQLKEAHKNEEWAIQEKNKYKACNRELRRKLNKKGVK